VERRTQEPAAMQGAPKKGKKIKTRYSKPTAMSKLMNGKALQSVKGLADEQFSLLGITDIVTVESRPLFDSGATYNRVK
jgi:hypothetical protein